MSVNQARAETVLVTGARGHVAQATAEMLLDAGVRVRAASREPESVRLPAGVEVVRADLSEPASLGAALDGVQKVFLYASPQGIDGVLEAAKAAGVEQIVLLSSAAVLARHPEGSP